MAVDLIRRVVAVAPFPHGIHAGYSRWVAKPIC